MPVLFDNDRSSAVWLRLKQHIEARVYTLRVQNDKPMEENKRNQQVGRIQELLGLLELEREKPTAAPD